MTTAKNKPRPSRKLSATVAPSTKIGLVLSLLQRKEGATLAEVVQATGWQPHTARAALTGLRKKGHQLHKTKRDEVSCYRVKGA
jgi:hypothetical protein